MTYDFFADEADKIEFLNYIFKETDLQIFDLDSPYGEKVKEYKEIADIMSCFDLKNEANCSVHFQLWSPQFKAEPNFRKIELNPKYCKGHTFRFSTEGWGLIQLYLRGVNGAYLSHSHIGHFNKKGALKWEGINLTNGKVGLWDWKAIQKVSSHLKYQLDKKFSVKRIGSFGVLKGAEELEKQGFILKP